MYNIPLNALVVMVGPSGAGKSTLIEALFSDHEVISSDAIRHELTGDFRNQHVNNMVFTEFYRRIQNKIVLGERVIADATHLRKKDRLNTAELGFNANIPVFYLVVNRPVDEKMKTGGWRLGVPDLIQKHENLFQGQEKDILSGDGKAIVIDTRKVLMDDIQVIKKFNFDDLGVDLRNRGYDQIQIIGDVHGMTNDFKAVIDDALDNNRMIIQLGDIVDYGPDSVGCLDLMYDLVLNGRGIFIIGNHERKLEKYFQQRAEGNIKVKVKGGLVATVNQLDSLTDEQYENVVQKFTVLMNYSRHHCVIDGNTIFVHAGITNKMWNIAQNRLVGFEENRAVFGEVDGFREDGYPNRIYNWVDELEAGKLAFVGHDIRNTDKPLTHNGKNGGKAVFVDTGSGKTGKLSSVILAI